MDLSNEYGGMQSHCCMMGGYPGMEPDFGMMPQAGPGMMPPGMMPQTLPYMGQVSPYMGQQMMPYADSATQNPTMQMEYMYMYYKCMCKYLEYMEKSKEYNKKCRD